VTNEGRKEERRVMKEGRWISRKEGRKEGRKAGTFSPSRKISMPCLNSI
jgi:hypothetical protein